jgi:putative hydrolase of the HAD superfamily
MINLITFDFWNTLFLDKDEGVRHRKRIQFAFEAIRRQSPQIEIGQVESAFAMAHHFFSTQWGRMQAISMKHHFEKMLSHLGLQLPEEETLGVVDYFESVLLEHPPVIISGATEAVTAAAQGRKLGLISDTGYSPGRTLIKILQHHGLDSSFHSFSFSNETGHLKPSRKSFEKVLNELEIEPQEAAHIGDLEETDIAGAKQMGMRAIKYIGSNPEENRASKADVVIDDWAQLPDALARL